MKPIHDGDVGDTPEHRGVVPDLGRVPDDLDQTRQGKQFAGRPTSIGWRERYGPTMT